MITTTLARRIVPVLGAGLALLAPLAAAPQAAALTTTVTSLSSITPSTATYGTAQTLKGKLATSSGKILAGRSVAIQAWDPATSTWVTSGTVTTDTKGAWSWARPIVEQTVKYRARYLGSSTYAADSSGSLTATVKAGVTWTSKPASTTYSAYGATVTAAGTALPGAATVSLQRYYSSAWHTISTQSVTNGAFSFPIAMTTSSTRSWRVKVDPTRSLISNYYYNFKTVSSKPSTWTVSTSAYGPFLKMGYKASTGQVAGTVEAASADSNVGCAIDQQYSWQFTAPVTDPLDYMVGSDLYWGYMGEWREGDANTLDGLTFFNENIKTTKGVHVGTTYSSLKSAYGTSLIKITESDANYNFYAARNTTTMTALVFIVYVDPAAPDEVVEFQLVPVTKSGTDWIYNLVTPWDCGNTAVPAGAPTDATDQLGGAGVSATPGVAAKRD